MADKAFSIFEARLLCLRFRRFSTFAVFPGAFINHVIYMLDKQSNMTSFFFLRFRIAMKTAVIPLMLNLFIYLIFQGDR